VIIMVMATIMMRITAAIARLRIRRLARMHGFGCQFRCSIMFTVGRAFLAILCAGGNYW
jgi:hypothetical protein